MLVIGVDPGFTGAVAILDKDGGSRIFDTPTTNVAYKDKTRVEFNRARMSNEIDNIIEFSYGDSIYAFLEDAGVMPKQGITSTGRFMHGIGLWEGMLIGKNVILTMVLPAAWKKHFKLLNKEKDDSIALAKKLFPAQESLLMRKKDHNRAEALLIAEYGRQLRTGKINVELPKVSKSRTNKIQKQAK